MLYFLVLLMDGVVVDIIKFGNFVIFIVGDGNLLFGFE